MKIFNFVLLTWILNLFPHVDYIKHTESQPYLVMHKNDRLKIFEQKGEPVVYLEYAKKISRSIRNRKQEKWQPIIFYFVYFCPIMDLDLREVIVKFEGFDPVFIQRERLDVRNMLKSNSQVVSRWEGRIIFRIDGSQTEEFIDSTLEYVQFVSDDNSPCQMDIKLEGFEKEYFLNLTT